jgi:hypothetical protein
MTRTASLLLRTQHESELLFLEMYDIRASLIDGYMYPLNDGALAETERYLPSVLTGMDVC